MIVLSGVFGTAEVKTASHAYPTTGRIVEGSVESFMDLLTFTGAETPTCMPCLGRCTLYMRILHSPPINKHSACRHQMKEQLRLGLSSLPAPRNDFEIVVPDDEPAPEEASSGSRADLVPDQADVEARREQDERERRERELRARSQTLQRGLPRATEVNPSVLRPANVEPPLSELQKVRGNSGDVWVGGGGGGGETGVW